MADNPVFEAGTARLPIGTTIAADDVGGGVLVQRVKPVFGTDGSATDVSATNPLPVTGTVTLSAGVTVASLTVTVKNAITLTATSRLMSITGTVSVQITSQPEQTLTGSYVDSASNALRTSATAASRLISVTGTVNVAIISSVPLTLSAGVTVGSLTVTVRSGLVSLTGSIVDNVNNALRVNIIAGAGSGGTAAADESAFTYGTTNVTPIGATIAADSITGSVVGALRMTTARGLHSHIVNSTGTIGAAVTSTAPNFGAGRVGVWAANEVTATQASLSATNLTVDISLLQNLTGVIAVQLIGTWAGDIFFESTIDGTNYQPIDAIPASGDTYVSETTANGLWYIQSTGSTIVRARASLSSGVANIFYASAAGGNVRSAAGGGGTGGVVSLTGTVSITNMPGIYAEDSAHTSTDRGMLILGVRNDAVVDLTDTDGDYSPLAITSQGAIRSAVQGIQSHDSAAPNLQPVLVGGIASAAAPADVSADTDLVRAWHLRNGAQATVITAAGELVGGDAANGLDVDVTRIPAVSLTGSIQVSGITNAITVNSHLVSVTGTVSVQITSQPEQTLTGSYVDTVSNALRGSLTAASRLFSLTGTASVQITSAVSLSVQITSTTVPFSLTGSFISAANNSLRVEGTLTFLAETRYAAPATSKLSRANFQFSTTASSTIVAGVGGQTIRLMKILFTTETAMTFQFESSTSAISSVMRLPQDGAMILDLDGEPWYITSTADPLRLHANNAASIGGTVWYTQS